MTTSTDNLMAQPITELVDHLLDAAALKVIEDNERDCAVSAGYDFDSDQFWADVEVSEVLEWSGAIKVLQRHPAYADSEDAIDAQVRKILGR